MQIITIKSKFLGGVFNQNTYVLKQGKDAIVIDAGAEVDDVKKAVSGTKLKAVLMTHLHFDHIWNIEKYIQEFDTDIFVCKGAEGSFKNSKLNASLSANKTFNVAQKNIKYYAEKLKIGKFEVEVVFTPGHSKDSVCLLINNNLFCGDTLFIDGVGRTDFEGGNSIELLTSLRKLKDLKFKQAFSGHYECFDKNQADKVIDYYI